MISKVLANYDFEENVDTIEKLDGGNVNLTYALTLTGGKKYVLQKINGNVFPRSKEVMANFLAIKRVFSDKSEAERSLFYPGAASAEKTLDKIAVPDIKLTRYGEPFAFTDGDVWRVFSFVKSNKNLHTRLNRESITEATGRAFGSFVRVMDGSRIPMYDVIADFHCPRKRIKALFDSADAAPADRFEACKDLLEKFSVAGDFIEKWSEETERNFKRIVHNDAKTDNILFSDNGGFFDENETHCESKMTFTIIDLDTTMYGFLPYDFGGGARSACSMTKEDEKNLSEVCFSVPLFKAYAKGYIGALSGVVSDRERECCAVSPRLIALELSARFLKDYLDGNKYFAVRYEEQNLVRARCQFALAEDISAKQKELKNIVLSV